MKALFCFCLALTVFVKSNAQPVPDSLVRYVQRVGDSLQKANDLPGLFVGVMNGNTRRYLAFGYAVPDRKQPFDSTTVFEAGSITKTFTAAIVEMVLKQKGIADSTSIFPYLPDSVRSNGALRGISFLSLLNHTSGLPRLPDNLPVDVANKQPYANYSEAKLFAYLKTATPKPDGKSNYSNLGAGLAGVLVSRMTGRTYEQLLTDSILKRFAMRSSSEYNSYAHSQGYLTNSEPVAVWQMAALTPAGGLQCTAEEMLNYLRYMSQTQSAYHKAIIDDLLQPTIRLSPTVQVAKGWHTVERKDKPIIYWHNGGTYGFSTFAAFIKGTSQAVIVVSNRFNSNGVTDALGMAIMRRLAP